MTVGTHIVGQIDATGVSFRTGPCTTSGERFASGLMITVGSFDRVIDNASCFAGTTFLRVVPSSTLVPTTSLHHHRPEEYPSEVLTFSDPTAWRAIAALVSPPSLAPMMTT